MQIHIAKYELYPAEDPIGYAVGYSITTGNNRKFYRDTIVTLEEAAGKTEEEILNVGWGKLENDIMAEVIRLEAKSDLLGNAWTPTTEVVTAPNEENTVVKSKIKGMKK